MGESRPRCEDTEHIGNLIEFQEIERRLDA